MSTKSKNLEKGKWRTSDAYFDYKPENLERIPANKLDYQYDHMKDFENHELYDPGYDHIRAAENKELDDYEYGHIREFESTEVRAINNDMKIGGWR